MKQSFIVLVSVIALLQATNMTLRKLYPKENRVHKGTLIIAESIIINTFLFAYILKYNDSSHLLNDIHKLTLKEVVYLIISSLSVTCMLVLLFDIIPKMDISKIGPGISIAKIIIFSILGIMVFDEKITFRKLIAFIFMIVGIYLLNYEL